MGNYVPKVIKLNARTTLVLINSNGNEFFDTDPALFRLRVAYAWITHTL